MEPPALPQSRPPAGTPMQNTTKAPYPPGPMPSKPSARGDMVQGTLARAALLSVDGPAGSAGTWAGGNEEEAAHSCARTGARVSRTPSGSALRGGTRYHSRLTDEETEARGRARKAGLPAAVEGCPPDFRLSQCGDPKAPVARRGAAPAVSMAGEGKAAGREERGADVWADAATCQQNRHSSSRC